MKNEILVVGSVALDTIKTPFGEAKEVLGGSAVYFSIAASSFEKVNVVGVVAAPVAGPLDESRFGVPVSTIEALKFTEEQVADGVNTTSTLPVAGVPPKKAAKFKVEGVIVKADKQAS